MASIICFFFILYETWICCDLPRVECVRFSTPKYHKCHQVWELFYYTENLLHRAVVYACHAAFRTNCLDYLLYARMNTKEMRKETWNWIMYSDCAVFTLSFLLSTQQHVHKNIDVPYCMLCGYSRTSRIIMYIIYSCCGRIEVFICLQAEKKEVTPHTTSSPTSSFARPAHTHTMYI